jgi:cell division initiation protein
MKLTPLDLQQKSFRTVRFGGLDEREVRAFLDQAASEMEEVIRKLHLQEEEVRRSATRIAEYQARESLLQSTLTSAQRMSEDMKGNARKEADLLFADAELQAEKVIANAQAKRLQLIGEIEELKRLKTSFLSQLGALIETHRAMLDASRSAEAAAEPPRVPVPQVGDNVSFLASSGRRTDGK